MWPAVSARATINILVIASLALLEENNDFLDLWDFSFHDLQKLRMQLHGNAFNRCKAMLVVQQLQNVLTRCSDLMVWVLK